MINLQFSLEDVNRILVLLGQLPFAEVNSTIQAIVEQAQPQVLAMKKENEDKDE